MTEEALGGSARRGTQSLLEWSHGVEQRWRPLRDWWQQEPTVTALLVAPPAAIGNLIPELCRVLEACPLAVNQVLLQQARRSPHWLADDCDQRLRGLLQTAWERLDPLSGKAGGVLLYDFELLFALRLHRFDWQPEVLARTRRLWLVPGAVQDGELWYYRASPYPGQRLPGDWTTAAGCWVLDARDAEPRLLDT